MGSRQARRKAALITGKEKALAAATAAQDRKGQSLTIIQTEGNCSYTDFLVIVTAYSDRQTSAIADGVVDDLKRGHGERPLAREGQGSWTLLDYGDVIVHVFHEDVRTHYNLDQLWRDAPRIPVPPTEHEGQAAV